MMEISTNRDSGKYRTLSADPQYFGGYLNMARLNVFNISNHIANEFNLAILEEDGHIRNSFLCDKSIKKNKLRSEINWNYIFSKTRRFLPVIKVFDVESLPKTERCTTVREGKDFALMCDTLKAVFTDLQEFRNDYSHFYSTEKADERKIRVSDTVSAFLTENFRRAIEYTRERFEGSLAEADYQLVLEKKVVETDNTITTEGLVFLTSMFLEREHAFRFIGKIVGLKGTQYNSFIATREVLMAYCLNLPHDKFQSDDTRQAFLLNVINELNRCPKILYDVITEDEKQKFRPQLDELKKKNLLENSSNNDHLTDLDDYEEYIEALTRKIRHSDRFADFALKFIDQSESLGKYRFQVDLGKLELDKYLKMFNGEEVERRIVEHAKAFGKPDDFNDENAVLRMLGIENREIVFEQFAPRYLTTNNKIGISGICQTAKIRTKKASGRENVVNLKQQLPEAFLSLNELPKIILLEYLEKGRAEKLISDFILANNNLLMDMRFIQEIKSKLPSDWNEFKRKTGTKGKSGYTDKALEYLLKRKEILNEVLSGYNLNDKQIPSRILDYWLTITDVDKEREVSERIKLMKRDCKARLNALRKFRDGKKKDIPKTGEMATFLARDIVDMVIDPEKKKKITSFYYDKMQECLALFADQEKKQLFIHIVNNELKLNDAGGHPFLKILDLSQVRFTSELYEKYLEEKGYKIVRERNARAGKTREEDRSWMARTFFTKEKNEKLGKWMTVVKIPANNLNVPFSIRQFERKTNESLEGWLHNITRGKNPGDGRRPVNLPTNLFDPSLAELLKQQLDQKQVIYQESANCNELFKIWWASRNDGVQPFYKATREYCIYNETVTFLPDSKAHFADYYKNALDKAFRKKQRERAEENRKAQGRKLPDIQYGEMAKVFKSVVAGTEKEIRMVQEKDCLMLLMLEQLMDNDSQLGLKLSQVNNLLNNMTEVKQLVTGKLVADGHGTPLRGTNLPVVTKWITANCKAKNASVLRRFVFDRRLPGLFDYFAEYEIPIDALIDELDAYERAKQEIFDLVFGLEKKIILTDKDGLKRLFVNEATRQPKTGNIQHKPYLMWLKNKGLIDEPEFIFMNMVRNCFSHNQFPRKQTMEKSIDEWENSRFAKQIAEVYKQKMRLLMSLI